MLDHRLNVNRIHYMRLAERMYYIKKANLRMEHTKTCDTDTSCTRPLASFKSSITDFSTAISSSDVCQSTISQFGEKPNTRKKTLKIILC